MNKIYSAPLVIILCLLVLISGLTATNWNKVQLLPDVDPPKISFSVAWPGANDNLLLTQVVEPYEQALKSKLTGFEQLLVKLSPEKASFELTFDFSTDLDNAEQQVRMLLARTRPLPDNVPAVVYRKGGNNVSNRVVGSYFVTPENGELTNNQKQLLKRIAEKQLATIKGIESVELNPSLDRQLSIELDPEKLAHYQISYQTVRQVIGGLFNQPVGSLYQQGKIIRARYESSDDLTNFAATPVVFINNVAVTLGELADIRVEPVRLSATARFNGRPALAMRVLRDSDANLIEMQKAVDAVIEQNRNQLESAGLTVNLSFDTSLFIERAIMWVAGSIATGFLLSLLVSWFFFRKVSPTVLGALITLLSVSGTMAVLYVLDVSINVISLAGITFAIGMFVDGALIISEYLDRKQDKTREGVIKQVWQLAPALIASTLTSVVVFLPVILNKQAEGQLFSGLALSIVSGLLISVTLTLLISPLFAHRFMKPSGSHAQSKVPAMSALHQQLTKPAMQWSIVGLLTVGAVGVSAFLVPSLSYLPSVKRDAIDVFIPQSGGEQVETVAEKTVNPLSELLANNPDLPAIRNAYALGWSHFVTGAVRLEDNEQLPAVLALLRSTLKDSFPGQRVIVMQGNLFGGMEDRNSIKIQLFVDDEQWLQQHLTDIKALLTEGIEGISVRFDPNVLAARPELSMTPQVENLRTIGMTERELKGIFRAMSGSDYVGLWSYQGDSLQAYLTFPEYTDNDRLTWMPVITNRGGQTYLGELVTTESSTFVPSMHRVNGAPAITANIRITDKNASVADIVARFEQHVAEPLTALMAEKGYFEVQGSAASLERAKTFLVGMLLFTFLAFFLIVSLIYRSVRISLFVLATLPGAIIGGILGFLALDFIIKTSFDVLTVIGFMIMLGIVANNSILLVDAMNKAWQQGQQLSQAVLTGLTTRFRSVLVSTITTVTGMLPLLILPSEASAIYRGIAAVVVGGMVFNLVTVFAVTGSVVMIFGLGHRPLQRQSLNTSSPIQELAS